MKKKRVHGTHYTVLWMIRYTVQGTRVCYVNYTVQFTVYKVNRYSEISGMHRTISGIYRTISGIHSTISGMHSKISDMVQNLLIANMKTESLMI